MCLVRVLAACIYKQLFVHRTAQFVFWQHATDTAFDDGFRLPLEEAFNGFLSLAAWVTRVADVFFCSHFVAGKADFFSIDDDHVIAGVHVGGEGRLVLAPQHMGDAGEQTACRLTCGIHHVPVVLHFFFLR